ncbi:unnamed protein product [Amoebophrya sp. A25]|nr:unnamed protein product [Amoebophrya sp. A25]|eukprot:GSA25T00019913001.1
MCLLVSGCCISVLFSIIFRSLVLHYCAITPLGKRSGIIVVSSSDEDSPIVVREMKVRRESRKIVPQRASVPSKKIEVPAVQGVRSPSQSVSVFKKKDKLIGPKPRPHDYYSPFVRRHGKYKEI